MCVFFNHVNGVFIFNFIVNFKYSGVFTVNFEHISHLARREKCQNNVPYTGKKKEKFNRLQSEVFCVFLPEYELPPIPLSPPPPNIGPSNLFFVRIYAQGILTRFYGIYVVL